MKWNKIGEKKAPEFSIVYLLVDENDDWFKGTLREIKELAAGKSYFFHNNEKGETVDNVTHFMDIKSPD